MLHPLEDNIILEKIEEEVTVIWLILPDDKKNKARVVAVWPWKLLESWIRTPIEVKPWDVVYFNKHLIEEVWDKMAIKYHWITAIETL